MKENSLIRIDKDFTTRINVVVANRIRLYCMVMQLSFKDFCSNALKSAIDEAEKDKVYLEKRKKDFNI